MYVLCFLRHIRKGKVGAKKGRAPHPLFLKGGCMLLLHSPEYAPDCEDNDWIFLLTRIDQILAFNGTEIRGRNRLYFFHPSFFHFIVLL